MRTKKEKMKVGNGDRPAKRPKQSESPKRNKNSGTAETVTGGVFDGVHALFIARGISKNRLKVWETRFKGLGGTILGTSSASSTLCDTIHILAADELVLSKEADFAGLEGLKNLKYLHYGWIEDCLKEGQLLSSDPYILSACLGSKNVDDETKPRLIPQDQLDLDANTGKPLTTSVKVVDHTSISRSPLRTGVTASEQGAQAAIENSQSLILGEEDLEENLEADDEAPDYNKHVAGILKEMSSIYEDFFGDQWRALTYRKAANKLDKLPFKISNAEDLKSIRGLGATTIKKIKEILQTGQLRRLESLKADPKVQKIQEFATVWGIGPTYAKKLYQIGYRSLEDISQEPSLPSMARIGLRYHRDILLRIPRAEVKEAGAFVQKVLEDLCPGAWLTVGGSYRRGHLTCGDIDLLITHPDGKSQKGLMTKLICKLQDVQFLTVSPRINTQKYVHKVETYMGICRLPGNAHHRRVDIKIYPKEIYAFALVYFTGNDVLNRRIRYFARTKGFKLSDQGLFQRLGYGEKSITSGVSIPCETEQDVFSKLGLPYPEPEDRNW